MLSHARPLLRPALGKISLGLGCIQMNEIFHHVVRYGIFPQRTAVTSASEDVQRLIDTCFRNHLEQHQQHKFVKRFGSDADDCLKRLQVQILTPRHRNDAAELIARTFIRDGSITESLCDPAVAEQLKVPPLTEADQARLVLRALDVALPTQLSTVVLDNSTGKLAAAAIAYPEVLIGSDIAEREYGFSGVGGRDAVWMGEILEHKLEGLVPTLNPIMALLGQLGMFEHVTARTAKSLHFFMVAVDPSWGNLGLSQALVAYYEPLARAHGLEAIWTEVTSQSWVAFSKAGYEFQSEVAFEDFVFDGCKPFSKQFSSSPVTATHAKGAVKWLA